MPGLSYTGRHQQFVPTVLLQNENISLTNDSMLIIFYNVGQIGWPFFIFFFGEVKFYDQEDVRRESGLSVHRG